MPLLTLDLGLTTGYAVLDEEGKILDHGEFDWLAFTARVVDLIAEYNPPVVLAETPVIIRGPLGDKLDWVVTQTRLVVPDVIEIHPARWKNSWWGDCPTPHPKNKKSLSTHQKDALRMGWWYLEVELKHTNIRANVLRNV